MITLVILIPRDYYVAFLFRVRRARPEVGTVPGVVPNLVGEISGCMFRNRCEFANDECKQLSDTPTVLDDGHAYSCRLSTNEIDAVIGD